MLPTRKNVTNVTYRCCSIVTNAHRCNYHVNMKQFVADLLLCATGYR